MDIPRDFILREFLHLNAVGVRHLVLFCLVADAGFFVTKVDGVEGRNPRKYARRVYVFMPSSGNRAGFLSVIPLLVDIIFVRHTSWEQNSCRFI